MGRKFIDLTGQEFGRLKAVEHIGTDKYGNALWECACKCGNTAIVRSDNLKSGNTMSCGCMRTEALVERLTGENNPNWKGEYVGYVALHTWVRRHKPEATACECCGATDTKLEAANISGEYKRDLTDYEWLCPSCHRKKDGKDNHFIQRFLDRLIEMHKQNPANMN